jgi:hypothetical protein
MAAKKPTGAPLRIPVCRYSLEHLAYVVVARGGSLAGEGHFARMKRKENGSPTMSLFVRTAS